MDVPVATGRSPGQPRRLRQYPKTAEALEQIIGKTHELGFPKPSAETLVAALRKYPEPLDYIPHPNVVRHWLRDGLSAAWEATYGRR